MLENVIARILGRILTNPEDFQRLIFISTNYRQKSSKIWKSLGLRLPLYISWCEFGRTKMIYQKNLAHYCIFDNRSQELGF